MAILAASAALTGCVPMQPDKPQLPVVSPAHPGKGSTGSAEPGDQETSTRTSEPSHSSTKATTTAKSTITTSAPAGDGEDDHGQPPCDSRSLRGALNTTGVNNSTSESGYLRLTNSGSRPCTLPAVYPGLVLRDREAQPMYNRFQNSLPPVPAPIVLQPGQAATSELRWWTGGNNCAGIAWSVDVRVIANDAPMKLEARRPDGVSENIFLCGDGILYVGGFAKT